MTRSDDPCRAACSRVTWTMLALIRLVPLLSCQAQASWYMTGAAAVALLRCTRMVFHHASRTVCSQAIHGSQARIRLARTVCSQTIHISQARTCQGAMLTRCSRRMLRSSQLEATAAPGARRVEVWFTVRSVGAVPAVAAHCATSQHAHAVRVLSRSRLAVPVHRRLKVARLVYVRACARAPCTAARSGHVTATGGSRRAMCRHIGPL